jgi:hypothetical protein
MDDQRRVPNAEEAMALTIAEAERRVIVIANAITPALTGLTPELLAGVQVEVLLAGHRAVLQLEGNDLVVDVFVTRRKRTDA